MTQPKMKEHAGWVAGTIALALAGAAGCGTQTTQPLDSESHWLRACEADTECGPFACLCGVCSVACDADAECDDTAPNVASSCETPAAHDAQCPGIDDDQGVCVPVSSDDGETEITVRGMSTLPALAPIPMCPELARTTSLPVASSITEVEAYDGPVTIDSILPDENGTARDLVLVPNALPDEQILLRFFWKVPSMFFPGQRLQALVRTGGEGSARYAMLVLRDLDGRLLLVTHVGGDALYQEGMFASRDVLGASLALHMLCQSSAIEGCFEDHVYAEYEATFEADGTLTTDGSAAEQLSIEGLRYDLTFWSTSSDGTIRHDDCSPEIVAGRTLQFSLLITES